MLNGQVLTLNRRKRPAEKAGTQSGEPRGPCGSCGGSQGRAAGEHRGLDPLGLQELSPRAGAYLPGQAASPSPPQGLGGRNTNHRHTHLGPSPQLPRVHARLQAAFQNTRDTEPAQRSLLHRATCGTRNQREAGRQRLESLGNSPGASGIP